jgi:hypothetical protein
VVARRLDLQASVSVLDGGAGAGGFAELFLSRRLGISIGVNGTQSSPTPGRTLTSAGGSVGAAYWLMEGLRVELAYAPTRTRLESDTTTQNYVVTSSSSAPPYGHFERPARGATPGRHGIDGLRSGVASSCAAWPSKLRSLRNQAAQPAHVVPRSARYHLERLMARRVNCRPPLNVSHFWRCP